jgi:hypothetical protein
MDVAAFESRASQLAGVRCRGDRGLLRCDYRGRLVARQLDGAHVVIRCSFELRGGLLESFPDTFSVPARFAKHMMIVADLSGDDGAIEDALIAAWQLQVAAG